jgi:pyrroloquinoline quinone (PQQ) biosynthesis protein C
MLKVWGVAHGVYPARAIQQWPPLPLTEEELSAWRYRWEEKRRERRPHGQP